MIQQLILGECLEEMAKLPDKSIDAIIADLPFGSTCCKWDVIIPFDKLWEQYERLIKNDGAIVLFGTNPFSALLVTSNLKLFKYSLVWEKSRVCHFAQAPYRFLTVHEDILVFSKAGTSKNAKIRIKYNPQGLIDCNKVCHGKGHSDHRPSNVKQKDYVQTKTNYPKSILKFDSSNCKNHPTEKPILLLQNLVKTFSNEGDLILDSTMGSGTTCLAAKNTGRGYVGIEKEQKYYDIALDRLKI